MIDDHDQGFLFLFKAFGSVIPRAFIWGVIGAVEGYLLDASKFKLFLHRNGPLGGQKLELWHHPYSVHVLGTVLGFALVMRVQIAYARFWEGATQLRTMSSKLADALMQLVTFDETPSALGSSSPAVFDEAAFEFRLTLLHYGSLFHALALIDVRGDEQALPGVLTVNWGDPYLFRVEKPSIPSVDMERRESMTSLTRLKPSEEGGPSESRVRLSSSSPLKSPPKSPKMPTGRQQSSSRLVSSLPRCESAHTADFVDLEAGPTRQRMPSASGAALPSTWRPGSAVPLQQVIRARRRLAHEDVSSNHGGMAWEGSASAYPNSVKLHDVVASDASVQPLSIWQGGGTDGTTRRRSVTRRSCGSASAGAKDGAASVPARSSTGAGGLARAGEGTSLLDYLEVVLFLRPSRHAAAKLASANRFDVVGGISEAERQLLLSKPALDRSFVVMTWMTRLMAARLRQGGLAVPAPLLSRPYQSLSEALLGAQQAQKLASHPFPYPLTQLLSLLLVVFVILVPMCVAAFVDCPPLVATLSFFVCTGYMALNEAARELEHPFGDVSRFECHPLPPPELQAAPCTAPLPPPAAHSTKPLSDPRILLPTLPPSQVSVPTTCRSSRIKRPSTQSSPTFSISRRPS